MNTSIPDDPRTERADALLGTLPRRGGRLKVFLGAAPGVGKTYAMLSAAKAQQARGIDVVVGLVETHGRSETAALLDGLVLLPRRTLDHRGHCLEELDLDGVLARRPQLALVDELAHTNAPGSRHGRRYQDIEELLDAGIDVYTTVNIQHLESQNDLVHRITGVRVRETVPDAFLDRADDIVIVDLPPRELIERLGQGKVYVPEMAASALQAFFSPSNLTALRELAVQQVADRVDADLREHLAARGVGPVPIRRRVLVAIDGSGNSEYLVRAARKLAERRQSPWTVAFVDTGVGAQRRLAVEQCLALARRLGAETAVLRGGSVVQELLAWARRHAVSSIVIGRTRERPLARMFNRTLTQQLLQQGAHFELTILNSPAARARSWEVFGGGERGEAARFGEFLFGAIVAALAVVCAWIADRAIDLDDLSPIFITAVLVVAVRTRMAVAVATALLCFAAYNFFFIAPRFTFAIGARSGFVTVLLFLAAALIAGRLATRLRAQVLGLRAANAHASALQALGRRLAVATDDSEILAAAVRGFREHFDAEVVLLQPDGDGRLRPVAAEPAAAALDATAFAAATWAAKHRQPAGRYTDTLQASHWWLLPVIARDKTLAVAALRWPDDHAAPVPEVEALAGAMLQDVAQALDRVRLGDALESARVLGETERLRAALLASVSHDLRSPLSTIVGSAESLVAYRDRLSADDQRQLADAILSEGRRLDRYIQNLLDMTRLGHGALKLERDWIALDEIVGAALARLRKLYSQQPAHATLAPDVPLLYVHPALIEQALFNILENAAKFSPPDAAVALDARVVDGMLRIDVIDRGPGIPPAERSRIFDMFYSVSRGDRGANGTGLGLAICQGMIGAHGGQVEALAGPDGRGTLIRTTLPLPAAPTVSQDD